MNDSQQGGGAALAFLAVGALLILPMGIGGAYLFYQRQRAAVLTAQARAQIAAEQMRAATARQALAQQSADQGTGAAIVEIESILNTQRDAWNAGRIEEFMDCYWRSDELSFNSAGAVTRGWQATLQNYKDRYPSRAEMGQLAFNNLDVKLLASNVAMVLGDWQLDRDPDPVGGNFTLILQRLEGKWLIVHDHTSRRVLQVE